MGKAVARRVCTGTCEASWWALGARNADSRHGRGGPQEGTQEGVAVAAGGQEAGAALMHGVGG